ncbi:MAG: UDP-N-acetylglucosamine 1-carboxyvinyltransferase [Promethearchaeota archaeon]
MEKFVIDGGIPLDGKINILGSKNAILPMMAASILGTGTTIIRNVPNLTDIKILSKLLAQMGAKIKYNNNNKTLELNCEAIEKIDIDPKLFGKLRGSILLLGSMLARFGYFDLWVPGGCKIGERKIDMHIDGLRKMGVEFKYNQKCIRAKTKNLIGTTYHFKIPTHTGTENLILASCLAKGNTCLINASCEPEIVDLASFMNSMGAKIIGAGTPIIKITGVKKLMSTDYQAMPSRIETSFFIAAAAITNGEIIISKIDPNHIDTSIKLMNQIGVKISKYENDGLIVKGIASFKPINVVTSPFPGFPTDFQPQLTALLSLANGVSVITENVFKERFNHVQELIKLRAKIKVIQNRIFIQGVPHLKSSTVRVTDIQTGAALLLAGLSIKGSTIINEIFHIDRGYETLDLRLNNLGASIHRYNDKNS